MAKTKIQKVFAYAALFGMVGLTSNVHAVQIGTGSITGGSSSAINWNGTYTTGSASGTVNGVVVTATVAPTLNMVVSAGTIALGTLSTTAYVTGSVDIEVGTNARNGVTVTAKSTNSGLTSATTGQSINSLATDGAVDSYKFTSVLNAASDSTIVGYTQTANLNAEVNSTASNTVYTTNKPEALSGTNDVTLKVSAKVNAQTAAATNYTDTVQITVTGNF